MKAGDKPVPINFDKTATVIFDYDPNVETIEKEGRNGTFDQIMVKDVNGRQRLLNFGTRVSEALSPFTKPSRVELTRNGKGLDVEYVAREVKK